MPKGIQNIVFKKRYWSVNTAVDWLKRSGYRFKDMDETENFYRFEQFAGDAKDRYYIDVDKKHPSIKYVVEI